MNVECSTYPADGVVGLRANLLSLHVISLSGPNLFFTDRSAYIKAMDDFEEGDIVVVTTPDDTHFKIGANLTACLIWF